MRCELGALRGDELRLDAELGAHRFACVAQACVGVDLVPLDLCDRLTVRAIRFGSAVRAFLVAHSATHVVLFQGLTDWLQCAAVGGR